MKIRRVPIEVAAIHVDNWQKLIRSAWLTSRPQTDPKDISMLEILKIDTPVSEMAGIVVRMKVPILIREIITSMRDHVIWARTSRVDDLTKCWEIVEDIDDKQYRLIKRLAIDLEDEVAKGNPQDSYRKHLPLSYMTTFTMRISIRSAIKLSGYLRDLGEQCPGIKGPLHQTAVKLTMILQNNLIPVCKDLIDSIKVPDYCPYLQRMENGRQGDVISVAIAAPIALRAQVVRHRELQVVDTLRGVIRLPNAWAKPIGKTISMQISAPVSVWKSIVAKRNCWLAQSDLWKPILQVVNGHLDKQELTLPCSDGTCPYDGDCAQRINKKDPGLPCPRNALLNPTCRKHIVAGFPNYVRDSVNYIRESKRPEIFWNDQIVELLKEL